MPYASRTGNNKPETINRKPTRRLRFLVSSFKFLVNRGFTLIELLIVITIIGILVATGTYSWQGAQVKARDNRRKADLKAIQQALEGFYQTNGKYPPTNNAGGWCTQISSTTYTDVKNALEPNFMTKIPQDPTSPNTTSDYFYYKYSHYSYGLFSTMENPKDPDYQTYSTSGCSGGSVGNYHLRVTNP